MITNQCDDVVKLAEGLSEQQRSIAVSLCGNAWHGFRPTPGILELNALELMHIDALKDKYGGWRRFKARPTPLGIAVRAYLQQKGSSHDSTG